jgi:hypothetical protein
MLRFSLVANLAASLPRMQVSPEMMMNSAMTMLYMQLVPMALSFLKPLLFILISLCGLKEYRINGNLVNKFEKLICVSTASNESGRHEGMVLGKWFIGWIKATAKDREAVYYGSTRVLKKLQEPSDEERNQCSKKEKKAVTLLVREGTFGWFNYTELKFYPTAMKASAPQQGVLEQLKASFNEPDVSGESKKRYCTALLTGKPGAGKSSIPLILANELLKEKEEVYFVDNFNPTSPGDSFDKLYSHIEPTKDKPMIVVLEEVDNIVRRLKEGIPSHKVSPILIQDKPSWNSFFDNFGKGRYRHVYFIMTSNKSQEWFDEEDPSYCRKGRCDLRVAF